MAIFEVFGRFHPLFLHLPIGILALAFLMELLSKKDKYVGLQTAIGFALEVGMWSSLLAAVSGYVLSLEGGYDEDLLWLHKWLGIGTAAIAIVVYILYRNKKSDLGKKLYLPTFGGLMLLMGAAGHQGGSLTHGSDFLIEPLTSSKKSERKEIADINEADVFNDVIQPILEERCVSCHSHSKTKGALLMESVEGLKKGGTSGAFLQAGSIGNSLFLQRINMPMEEKEHMPPKGKKQLTSKEISLLEWWVDQGASYTKNVGEIPKTEEIETILKQYEQSANSVLTLDIVPAAAGTIATLQQADIKISKVLVDNPFLSVSLRGRKDLNASVFESLGKIASQVLILDLSDTNLNDELFAQVKNFPHLQKLSIQKTEVTGSTFDAISDLEYLENLNVYSTSLNDEAVDFITKIKSLKKLYVWDTEITKIRINQLKEEFPLIMVNDGIDKSIFGKGKLEAPAIIADNDIFVDSLLVTFDLNLSGVDFYYTLDGTKPDSTSNLYNKPFSIRESVEVQVIAKNDGWITSVPAIRSFAKVGHQPIAVNLNKKPNEKYKASGAESLINMQKGTTDFSGGEWLGYEKSHFEATLDLGDLKEVSSVAVSALEAVSSYIFFPKKIEVFASKDNNNYKPLGVKNIPTTSENRPAEMDNFIVKFAAENTRYLKIKVKSNLVNPEWHPAPGAGCWVFVDEIMIE